MASDHGCPIEIQQIPIEKCDEMFDKDCKGGAVMPFHRARYDKSTGQSPNSPREQVIHLDTAIYSPRICSSPSINADASFTILLLIRAWPKVLVRLYTFGSRSIICELLDYFWELLASNHSFRKFHIEEEFVQFYHLWTVEHLEQQPFHAYQLYSSQLVNMFLSSSKKSHQKYEIRSSRQKSAFETSSHTQKNESRISLFTGKKNSAALVDVKVAGRSYHP